MNWQALLLSFEIALAATGLSALVGLGLAAALAGRQFFGRSLVDALLVSPLVLPPTVLGYALLVLLGRRSSIGLLWEHLFGSSIVFTRSGAIVAASVTAVPLIWQTARAALESVNSGFTDAARTLGAGPLQVLLKIQIPLASRGIAAGLMLAFARALGDFGVTLMVAGNLPGETQTASLAIYDALLSGHDSEAFGLALTLTCVAVALMAVTTFMTRRSHER